jgi:hypothetical protein
MRASRQLKQAEAAQLEAMSDAAGLLTGSDRFINPLVLTSLCDLREEIATELGRRRKSSGTETAMPATAHLRTVRTGRHGA